MLVDQLEGAELRAEWELALAHWLDHSCGFQETPSGYWLVWLDAVTDALNDEEHTLWFCPMCYMICCEPGNPRRNCTHCHNGVLIIQAHET